MANTTSIFVAEKIMGTNFIGPKQVKMLLTKMKKNILNETTIPEVNYNEDTLTQCASDYILVYGINSLNILDFRNFFGIDPEISEPCFYNQDWYMSENFVQRRMDNKWYLIKKKIIEDTRAAMPMDIISSGVKFPSAILCVYTFFAYYVAYGEMLWCHDFIWCEDVDHNGDRIYVAKYHDIDGINKNGFSIHRHLALRHCYASTNLI